MTNKRLHIDSCYGFGYNYYEAICKYRRLCKCGHTYIISPVCNKDFVVCSWCGRRVYKNEELQKIYENECKKKDFKKRLTGILRINSKKK